MSFDVKFSLVVLVVLREEHPRFSPYRALLDLFFLCVEDRHGGGWYYVESK